MKMDGSVSSGGSLESSGVNFSNQTQAADFLDAILNDDELKLIGNAYARYFWYGIAVAVGVATFFNLVRWTTLRMRLRASTSRIRTTSRPKNIVMVTSATITALLRESTYLQWTPTTQLLWLRVPPMGTIILILTHFAFVLTLEFTNNDVPGAQFWQARGIRAGWLAVAQVPLLVLLASKKNIIGMLTGVSYERINVLHRWTARIMLFLSILHFGYQSYGWQRFGLMKLEWATDSCPPTGVAAFALLLWMNMSTLAPFRNWSYEFFIIQHLITFFGFIIAIMMHLPDTALWSRIYIYIPIALYLLDRILRTALFAYFNIPAKKATLIALEGGVTKIRLTNKSIKSWSPGAYVLLSIPKFGWTESHPATIISTPQSHDGDMIFMLKSYGGFTKRIMTRANNSATALLPHTNQECKTQKNLQVATYHAFTNGPYGGSHSDFAAFDSVCFIAGSTGVTFILAIFLNLAERAALSGMKLPVRRVHFVWCVKDVNWTSWCANEISSSYSKLTAVGIQVDISVYVTCADTFTDQSNAPKECGCACDKSLGPCCCVFVSEDPNAAKADYDAIEPATVTSAHKVDEKFAEQPTASSVESGKAAQIRLQALPCAAFYSGRPEIPQILANLLDGADGESGVAVCGPIAMSTEVRNNTVRLSDERAIHKGSGAQGCYLHVESFS